MTQVLMLFAFLSIGILKPSLAYDKIDNLAEAIFDFSRNYKFINNIELFLCPGSSSDRKWEIQIGKMLMAKNFYSNVKLIDAVTDDRTRDMLAIQLSSIKNSSSPISIIVDIDCPCAAVLLKLVGNCD